MLQPYMAMFGLSFVIYMLVLVATTLIVTKHIKTLNKEINL